MLNMWLDDLGFRNFIDLLLNECRDRAEYLFDELESRDLNELSELEKRCDRRTWFKDDQRVPSTTDARQAEMWRNAVRGLMNLRGPGDAPRMSLVGLPLESCYAGGFSKAARKITRRELKEIIRVVELVVLPEIVGSEGSSIQPGVFADGDKVRAAYARLKEAMAAYDAARDAA